MCRRCKKRDDDDCVPSRSHTCWQAVCGRNRLEQYDSLGYIAYTQGSDHATQLTFT